MKISSLNYIRKCRILTQIIGDTITAMKLSVFLNWTEIFFYATTRRQVPCCKPPRYVPYICTYVPYDGTFAVSNQGQMLDLWQGEDSQIHYLIR